MIGKIFTETDQVEQYIFKHGITESPFAKELRLKTHTMQYANMMSSAEQVQLFVVLIKLLKAQRIAEIGVFTGYSTLRFAEAMPENSEIFACDITDKWISVGKKYWEKAGVLDKITPIIAPAEQTLNQFIRQGWKETFDLIYIDADKSSYLEYYKASYQLVRQGGMIILDNTLWGCDAFENIYVKRDFRSGLKKVNTYITEDKNVEHVILPIGDGVTIALKK